MGKISWFTIAIVIFVFVWCSLFLSVFLPDSKSSVGERKIAISEEISTDVKLPLDSQETVEKREEVDTVLEPRRYHLEEQHYDPPPLSEIERNMTLYLHTLHSRLGALAGPNANAERVWEEYLDVTKSMPMAWDDQNKHRIPEPKLDGSIYVSLGTYRDPYCPMTLKSLYSQAKNPEKLFVGLLQQNCFLEKCRTGVLVGGKVEDMGPDVDCYKEFCKSPEGIRSGACNTGQVRLSNIHRYKYLKHFSSSLSTL